MSETIKDWTTKSGLRAVILLVHGGSHHCGYVEIPKEHPLFGKHYSDKCCPQLPEDTEIGKRGVIPLLCHDLESEFLPPDVYFDVHGGITFSEKFKHESDGWWFGFDCSHAGDKTSIGFSFDEGVWRGEDFCIAECESLAKQLTEIKIK